MLCIDRNEESGVKGATRRGWRGAIPTSRKTQGGKEEEEEEEEETRGEEGTRHAAVDSDSLIRVCVDGGELQLAWDGDGGEVAA